MSKSGIARTLLSIACATAIGVPLSTQAATSAQINAAIQGGLDHLSATQQAGGNWSYWGGAYDQAATGAAVFAMLSQKNLWGGNATTYQGDVDDGMRYLLATATTATVSTRAGDPTNICPGGSGSCTAVYWQGSNEPTYTTGQVAAAVATYAAGRAGDVATSTGPLAGMTWGQIAQGIVNTFAAAQSAIHNYTWGGWRYGLPSNTDADSSTTQWAAIAMIYSQTLGATVPAIVKQDLANHWLPAAQAASGVACYQPNTQPCDHADTGGLLLALDFVGPLAQPGQVTKALNFLNANWQATPSGTWYGNFGHPYAMWAVYKGLELTIGLNDDTVITNHHASCGTLDPGVTCNWWQDYNEYLVGTQLANGAWTGYDYWTDPLATAYYLPILGGTAIPDGNAPEPGSLGLVGLAIAALATYRRRVAS